MRVHTVEEPPDAALARALADFEQQFSYPLGPSRSFRISHGEDYARFFRALGRGACFVAERDGAVLGTLGVALRRLRTPSGEDVPAGYLGDLKVAPAARGAGVIEGLIGAASAWDVPRPEIIYGVVMAGTAYRPPAPVVGEVLVLRLATAGSAGTPPVVSARDARGVFDALSLGRYAAPACDPAGRSELTPVPLVLPEGSACGLVEDTRRAKRLIGDDGAELASAHLSDFAYRSPADGADLVRAALAVAAGLGAPHLFLAVPMADAEAFRAHLGSAPRTEAGAAVHGVGLTPGHAWHLNTAEI